VDYETPFGYAWGALRSIADDKLAPVAVQLNAQRAMDNLRTLYPPATEGLES
jgi:hypothetical protein